MFKPVQVAGTQQSLFDETPAGQRLLFSVVTEAKPAAKKAIESSLLESIESELKTREAKSKPVAGQIELF